jgi:sialate O-acetylesterase
MRVPGLAILSLAATLGASAAVRLPALVSDGLVLPANRTVAIWGWADPGESVEVAFAGHTARAKAAGDGAWKVMLPPLPASGEGRVLAVRGANHLLVRDVLVGEVWLASGQSNMAVTLATAREAARELAAADRPQLRVFSVESGFAPVAQVDCRGRWVTCTPEAAAKFSAVGYFFAQSLQSRLSCPVGLVVSALGATAIQAWTSRPAQEVVPALAPVLARQFATSVAGPGQYYAEVDRKNEPGVLFNAMIAPLLPFGFRGVVWYHGENNTRDLAFARLYGLQLATLIGDWRTRWGREDLPFAWVQLPAFSGRGRPGWSLVREEMRRTLALPHTGMAVVFDIGDASNLHPPNKRPVGERLADWALAAVYGRGGASSGPAFLGATAREGEILLRFAQAEGLHFRGEPGGSFEVAGSDRRWYPARARIDGEAMVLRSDNVAAPLAVRYAWSAAASAVLYNRAGLPASPFRTEEWD